MMDRYFTQDLEIKMKDWYQNSGQGYWELGRETSAGGKKADLTKNLTAEEKNQYLQKYPDGTVEQFTQARLMEMGTITDPTFEQVKALREKGLLTKPPEALVNKYPGLFKI